MEKDQLLRWAVKAGAWPEMSTTPEKDIAFLERFAALVAAHEREQCALVCDKMGNPWRGSEDCAEAIRARSAG